MSIHRVTIVTIVTSHHCHPAVLIRHVAFIRATTAAGFGGPPQRASLEMTELGIGSRSHSAIKTPVTPRMNESKPCSFFTYRVVLLSVPNHTYR
jgi:hypothetical protein